MRKVFILIIFLLSIYSCTSKYSSSHKNLNQFNKDVDECLKKSCDVNVNSFFYNFSLISPLMAYGGGGGGGGGSNFKDGFSYSTFSICLEEKGYFKDKNGIFKLSSLSCK